MKFFSCPILADRVHTYFEIIHKYPGDNCPGYNGHWVGPSWVIVIIVTRHNCPLSSAAHLHIPPPLWHILDISSASKITRYKDPELDKQVSVTLSWHGQRDIISQLSLACFSGAVFAGTDPMIPRDQTSDNAVTQAMGTPGTDIARAVGETVAGVFRRHWLEQWLHNICHFWTQGTLRWFLMGGRILSSCPHHLSRHW